MTHRALTATRLTAIFILCLTAAAHGQLPAEPPVQKAQETPSAGASQAPAASEIAAETTEASPEPPQPAEKRKPGEPTRLPKRADVLSLTVSGGVSLGAYEAGTIYMLAEALRRSPGATKLRVASGASAGSANALVVATEACDGSVSKPNTSIGYQIWVNVGLDDLFDPTRVTDHSVFHRDAMARGVSLITDRWLQGLSPACDFGVGVTVTRQKGYDVHLAPNLVVPRHTERFTLRVRGRGPGRPPIIENYLDPSQSFERPLLPLSDGTEPTGKKDVQAVQQLIMASGAFPVAFDAAPIEYCQLEPPTTPEQATAAHPLQCRTATHIDQFIDGGIFDNSPLGVAYALANDGLVQAADGAVTFRPVADSASENVPQAVFGFLDPSLRTYPLYKSHAETEGDSDEDPVIDLVVRLGGQVLSNARKQELASMAEHHPEMLDRLWLLEASYPPISELLGAFFGFFEKDFRDFDYHLGLYESLRGLRQQSKDMLGVGPYVQELEQRLRGPAGNLDKSDTKLGCLLAHFEPDRYRNIASLCQGDDLRNFRILLQVTLDRLWSNCRHVSNEEVGRSDHLQCKRARGGLPAPQVDSSFSVKGKRYQSKKESDFDYSMRLLTDYKFHFKDLGLTRAQSKKGRTMVRRRLEAMVMALSDAQKHFVDRTMTETLGRMFVNDLKYEPPKKRGYIVFGASVAGGYLGRLGEQNVLYYNIDASVHQLRALAAGRIDEFTATLSAGLNWALLPLSGSVVQSAVGLRAGYLFGASDAIGFQPCEEDEVADDSRMCSQPVIHLPLNITLLERVRVSATPTFFLLPQDWGHRWFGMEFGVGAEFF